MRERWRQLKNIGDKNQTRALPRKPRSLSRRELLDRLFIFFLSPTSSSLCLSLSLSLLSTAGGAKRPSGREKKKQTKLSSRKRGCLYENSCSHSRTHCTLSSSPTLLNKNIKKHASLAAEPAAETGHSAGTNADAYARLASNPATKHVTWPKFLNAPLSEVDPALVDIIEKEKNRQWKGLELIPSENFVSSSVMEAVGSVMTNKYSEGYPGEEFCFFFFSRWVGVG